LDHLEAAFEDLRAILDDSLALINRLRELEIDRRAKAKRKKKRTVSRP